VIPFKPEDVSLQLQHVLTCQCRYVIIDGEEVKVIDTRCISAYLAPAPPPRFFGHDAHGDYSGNEAVIDDCTWPLMQCIGHETAARRTMNSSSAGMDQVKGSDSTIKIELL
jgi:hypothetical protein